MNTLRSSIDTHTNGNNTDFSLTRRSLLGALGAGAAVGLAGCAQMTNQEFTAPIIGFKRESFSHYRYGDRPVTLENYESTPIVETRDMGDIGDLEVTLHSHATSYNWQLQEDYPATVGFVSIPIPIVLQQEFPGPLDDTLTSLVTGTWGLELFNKMGFADDPVQSVRYGSSEREEFTRNSNPNNSLFRAAPDAKVFDVRATLDDGSEEEYVIALFRYRTVADQLSSGTDDSYAFLGLGVELEKHGEYGTLASFNDSSTNQFGVIPTPE